MSSVERVRVHSQNREGSLGKNQQQKLHQYQMQLLRQDKVYFRPSSAQLQFHPTINLSKFDKHITINTSGSLQFPTAAVVASPSVIGSLQSIIIHRKSEDFQRFQVKPAISNILSPSNISNIAESPAASIVFPNKIIPSAVIVPTPPPLSTQGSHSSKPSSPSRTINLNNMIPKSFFFNGPERFLRTDNILNYFDHSEFNPLVQTEKHKSPQKILEKEEKPANSQEKPANSQVKQITKFQINKEINRISNENNSKIGCLTIPAQLITNKNNDINIKVNLENKDNNAIIKDSIKTNNYTEDSIKARRTKKTYQSNSISAFKTQKEDDNNIYNKNRLSSSFLQPSATIDSSAFVTSKPPKNPCVTTLPDSIFKSNVFAAYPQESISFQKVLQQRQKDYDPSKLQRSTEDRHLLTPKKRLAEFNDICENLQKFQQWKKEHGIKSKQYRMAKSAFRSGISGMEGPLSEDAQIFKTEHDQLEAKTSNDEIKQQARKTNIARYAEANPTLQFDNTSQAATPIREFPRQVDLFHHGFQSKHRQTSRENGVLNGQQQSFDRIFGNYMQSDGVLTASQLARQQNIDSKQDAGKNFNIISNTMNSLRKDQQGRVRVHA